MTALALLTQFSISISFRQRIRNEQTEEKTTSKAVALRLLPFSDAQTMHEKNDMGNSYITNRLLCQ